MYNNLLRGEVGGSQVRGDQKGEVTNKAVSSSKSTLLAKGAEALGANSEPTLHFDANQLKDKTLVLTHTSPGQSVPKETLVSDI